MARKSSLAPFCWTVSNFGTSRGCSLPSCLTTFYVWGTRCFFYVSMLRKYIRDPSHVLPHQEFEITPEVQYEVQPLRILDCREKVLRNKTIPLVKVMLNNHSVEEATWELEREMQKKYPALFEVSRTKLL